MTRAAVSRASRRGRRDRATILRSHGSGLVARLAPLVLALLAVAAPLGPASAADEEELAPEIRSAALVDHLRRFPDDPAGHRAFGELLLEQDELDVAAHHLDRAAALFEAGGDTREASRVESDLNRADPLNRRRHGVLRNLTRTLLKNAEQLADEGHLERALKTLEGLLPYAVGDDAAEARALHEDLAKRFEELDIEEGLDGPSEDGPLPLVTHESAHYVVEANLEPELAERVGDLMDSVHGHYVDVYFAGDEGDARAPKATIRIHPDWDAMAEEWEGPQAPQGWWSPGQNRVVCYDSRSNGEGATLDWMLETLFHEASHQFMTLRARKGGWSPSWLNEGTSSFFEGTIAMADNTVLWPEAALGRLRNLARMLRSGDGPSLEQVIGYSDPGSYPGNYYAFGWGIVYYLQQYEDPETLEYVYRPLYDECLDEITTKGGDSREMFERYFVGRRSPRGHETFEDFVAEWEAWILDEVLPLHLGSDDRVRELRLAAIERYIAAADAAAEDRRAPVEEEELLRRALGHVEYVRQKLDDPDAPNVDLWLTQVDLLVRLEREKSAAPLLQDLLEFADEGLVELSPELADELDKRLLKLDRGNWVLRNTRSREKRVLRSARDVLEDYERKDPPFVLRAYTFAKALGDALDDEEVLLPRAAELREIVRERGLLLGRIRALSRDGDDWWTLYQGEPERFVHDADRLLVESVRPMAYCNTSFEVDGEYQLRCTLRREGELYLSSNHGLVISAAPDADWAVLDFGAKGNAYLRRLERTGSGAMRRLDRTLEITPPLADDEHPRVALRLSGRAGTLTVGERDPISFTLPEGVPPARHVGLAAKDARVVLEDAEVEILP